MVKHEACEEKNERDFPRDWEIKPLAELADVVMGQSPLGSTYNKSGDGIALINGPTEFTKRYPVKKQWTNQPTKLCQKGDLLICVRGSSTGRLNFSNDEYCIGRGVAAIRGKNVYIEYIANQLQLEMGKLLNLTVGSTFPNIDGSTIKSIPILIPKMLDEQKAIVQALFDTEQLICSMEKLIEKKCLIKQGAMQDLLKPKTGWLTYSLDDLFIFNGGYTATREKLSDEGYCYLHYGDIHGSKKAFIDVGKEYTYIPKLMVDIKKISSKVLLSDGDVVFVDASEDDDGTSRHVVIKNSEQVPFIAGLHTIVAKSKTNLLDNGYRQYCFQSNEVKFQFKFYAVGTKVSGVSKTNIGKITVTIPAKIDEQKYIAEILSDMDSEISVLENKLSKYRQIKQGMMQELLTGRIRLYERGATGKGNTRSNH